MLCALYIFDIVTGNIIISYEDTFKSTIYHFLALFKIVFTKYLQVKFGNKLNVNKYIISVYNSDNSGEKQLILKTFKFINQFVKAQLEVEDNEEKTTEGLIKFLAKLSHYEKIKDDLDDLDISIQDIEDMVVEIGDKIVQIDNSEN